MCKSILQSVKASLSVMAIFSSFFLQAQNAIDKDNTRPEINRLFSSPASITSFMARKNNGYNEIQWTSRGVQDTRKFIVEYSTNGVYFQVAGEALATLSGTYQVKHQTFESAPLLYRVRIEDLDGRYTYSQNFLLDGIEIPPVKIYPTILTSNVVNVVAGFPVERIAVFSSAGLPVYSQAVNGKSEYLATIV
ncbi:MAG: hypothetical protein ABI688_03375, partial [Bacteroidota bacterium]